MMRAILTLSAVSTLTIRTCCFAVKIDQEQDGKLHDEDEVKTIIEDTQKELVKNYLAEDAQKALIVDE